MRETAQIELAFVNIRLAVRNIRLGHSTVAESNAANNVEARLKDADKLFSTLNAPIPSRRKIAIAPRKFRLR